MTTAATADPTAVSVSPIPSPLTSTPADIELRLDLARNERRQEDPDHSIELSTTLRF